MNYYNRYPGDYSRDTQDLSLAEHGAYTLLLDYLYGTEQVLPKNPVGLYRVCRAFTKDEQDAVDRVVSRFFVTTDDGYTNPRTEKELEAANARRDAARANGAKGGRGNKKTHSKATGFQSAIPTETHSVSGMEPSGEALHQPSNISKPYGLDIKEQAPARVSKRATQVPNDFVPDEAGISLASENRIAIHDELPRFIDYWKGKGEPRKDWQATWRTWVRNAVKFESARGNGSGSARPASGRQGIIDNYAAQAAAARGETYGQPSGNGERVIDGEASRVG